MKKVITIIILLFILLSLPSICFAQRYDSRFKGYIDVAGLVSDTVKVIRLEWQSDIGDSSDAIRAILGDTVLAYGDAFYDSAAIVFNDSSITIQGWIEDTVIVIRAEWLSNISDTTIALRNELHSDMSDTLEQGLQSGDQDSLNIGDAFVVQKDGKIGIGTKSPSAFIHAYPTISNDGIRIQNSTGAPSLFFYDDNANAATRNWRIATNEFAFGDIVFEQSNAKGGNPYTTGTIMFSIGANGDVTFNRNLNVNFAGTFADSVLLALTDSIITLRAELQNAISDTNSIVHPHANLIANDSSHTASLTQNVWINVTNPYGTFFNEFDLVGITTLGDTLVVSQNGHHLGWFMIEWTASAKKTFEARVMKNSTELYSRHHTLPASGDTIGITINFYDEFTVGDYIYAQFRNTDSNDDATWIDANLFIRWEH